MPSHLRKCLPLSLVAGLSAACALALFGCSKESPATAPVTSTQPAPTTAQEKPKPPRKKLVFVFKIGGISYSEACKAGAKQVNDNRDLNAEVKYEASTEGTAEKQAEIIDQAIIGKPDAIIVSPVDAKAVVPAINRASAAGIKTFTWDSDAPDSKRLFYVTAVDDVQIGADIMDALAKSIGGKGKVLIFSGQRTAENLSKHVQGMEQAAQKYPGITLVKPYYYNDDDKTKATVMAVQALQANPDAVGIACANSPSPPAAGEAIRKSGRIGKVHVWGLALPSETKTYLKDGSVDGLYLWDPASLTSTVATLALRVLNDNRMPVDGEVYAGGHLKVANGVVIIPNKILINKESVDRFKF